MTETEAIILGACIGFAGSIITGVLGIIGGLKISDRERKIKNFNDAAELLQNVLIKTQQRIEIINKDRTMLNSIKPAAIVDIIKNDFIFHDEMAKRFRLCITDKDIGITKAWNNYQYWYDEIVCQGTTDKIFPELNPNEDKQEFKEALKANPYDLIQKIIENTKNK